MNGSINNKLILDKCVAGRKMQDFGSAPHDLLETFSVARSGLAVLILSALHYPNAYGTLRAPGLFICSLRQINLPRYQIKMPRISCEAFVARSGFEPEHTEPESVVLPLYYQAKTEMAFRAARYVIIVSEFSLLQSQAAQ